jgi:FkbM family methyltransferase
MLTSNSPPTLYRLLGYMRRKRIRGADRLLGMMRHSGYLNRVARFDIAPGNHVFAPLFTDNYWDNASIQRYEAGFLATFAKEAQTMPGDVVAVDCGANFGLFSARLASLCCGISCIMAYEPNEELFKILAVNSKHMPVKVIAKEMAVANFIGRGKLSSPTYDSSVDAKFLCASEDGPIQVTQIDAEAIPKTCSVVIKIDVEGGELQVIEGAVQTLRDAPAALVAIEHNPRVVARTGICTLRCLKVLQSIRPFDVYVAEIPAVRIRSDVSIEQQLPDSRRVYNLICRSK